MEENHTPVPEPSELKEMAISLIHEQSTMTLATARDHSPWAAPVYYAFAGKAFYFFSDPKSRHISDSATNREVAAAIFAASDSWKGIRGMQMSGAIRNVRAGLEALRGLQAYMRKYAFVREFFTPGKQLDLEAFSERFRVRFYAFKPRLIYYLDNRIRFGFREEIRL